MANEDLGTLRYGIEVDTKGVDKGQEAMDGLQKSADDTAKKVDGAEKSIDKVGKTSDKTAKDVDKLDKSTVDVGVSMRDAVGYATAFAASLGAVAAISAESAKEIQNMARLSGTSVEEFQKLAFGANEAGISAEKLGDIYKDTQDKVGDFLNTGGGELADYFENIAPKVGQTAEQFRGLSGPEALGLFQQGLEKANLSAAEQIFYLESLANDASLLSPLLADNGRGFAEAGKRAGELNVVLSQFQIDELVEVNKQFNELSTTISRGTQSIVADNAEDIIDAIQSVTETIATATEFLEENMDVIKSAATILGSAALAYGTYRAAVIASTAATAAFNLVLRANPLGLAITAAGALGGAFLALGDEAETAAGKVKKLTGETQALSYVERRLLATKLEDRALKREKELDVLKDQLKTLEDQRKAEVAIQEAGRGKDDGALGATQRRIEAIKEEVKLLKKRAEELRVSEIVSGADSGPSGANVYSSASDDLQKLIDKYNPLLAEQRELLEEQEKLRKALQDAASKDVPEITKALDVVGKKLDEVRSKINLKPDSSNPLSIFGVGANTSDDFSDVIVNNLSPKLNNELGVQAKTFGSRLSDEFGKLDWGSYGQNIGDALGQALVSGDSSGLRSALGGMLSNVVSSSVGPALTSSLTSALGAGAAGFLGPIGGGIAGAFASGILSGKEEVSRSVQIVFEDGIAQAFTNIEYDSMLGGSNKVLGFDFLENEMLNNTLRNATRGIDELLEDLGKSVDDFSGTFEGADLGEAIENFTDSYIDAGFGSIEAFQELGESAEQALSRVTSSINELNEAIRGVVGEGTELAVQDFIESSANAIDFVAEQGADYWSASIAAIEDLNAGLTEPAQAGVDDLVRSSEQYQRAFEQWQSRIVGVSASGETLFETQNVTDTASRYISYIEQNQLPEAVSRLGEGIVVATADFAEELESLIDGGDVKGALQSLSNVIATDSENYAEQIKNLQRDLESLGFDADISAEEFASQYEEALSGVVTPEILARFANASVLIEGIGDAAESLTEQTDKEFDLLTEYFRELGRDDIADLRDTFVELGDAMTETERSIIKAIAEQERLNDARDDEVDKLGNLLSILRKAADTELDELREQLDGQIERSSDALKDLRDDINDQIEAEQKRADNEVKRLQGEQDATSTAISNAKSLINLLDNAMNTLAERSEDLQATLFKRSFAEISAAIETARNTGELPDAQLIEGAVRSISTAGTGNFATSVEREREALKARILLSELNELSDDQLTTDEKTLKQLESLETSADENSDSVVRALEQQLEDAENNHDDLVDSLDAQYEAQQDYYDETIDIWTNQLDALNGINDSFDSFAQVLSEVIGQSGIAVGAQSDATAGIGATITDQDIRDFLSPITADNYVSDTEAQDIYNAALSFGVSSSRVGDILNDMLSTTVDVQAWLDRNNLASIQGSSTATIEAINNMTNTVSGSLGRIEASTTATATALDNVTQGNELTVRTA